MAISSTVVLVACQLTLELPQGVTALLVAKHVGGWLAIVGQAGVGWVSGAWVGWTTFRVYVYILSSNRDAAASADKPAEHEDFASTIYDSLPVGISVLTDSLAVLCHNPALLSFLQIPTSDRIFSCLSQLHCLPEYTPGPQHSSIAEHVVAYARSGEDGYQALGVSAMNDRYLEWSVKRVKWRDQPQAFLLSATDVSKWVEQQMAAKQESESKSALVRSVSHELRTPTNAIINIVQDIREKEDLSEDSLKDMMLLGSSAQFLLSMVNDLLDYSSIVNGRLGLAKQYFSLKQVLTECVSLIEAQCKHKQLGLLLRYDYQLPTQVYSDKNRLKQVILNLLSNALKFTMSGRIEVVAVSVSDSHAGVRVFDTGIGIHEDNLDKIFTLFGKVSGNEKLNPQGCGLGLGISNMLVKSLGGHGLHVRSKRHSGSVFGFEFLITSADPGPMQEDPTNETPETWEGVEQITIPGPVSVNNSEAFPSILIADDVDYNRIVLRRLLESVGYDCEEATTGLQVLQLTRLRASHGRPYSIIFMDVEMPEMTGLSATLELWQMVARGELDSSPVIIGCSAYSSAEDREKCLRAGMQHYLVKPIDREVLFDLVTSIAPRRVPLRATISI